MRAKRSTGSIGGACVIPNVGTCAYMNMSPEIVGATDSLPSPLALSGGHIDPLVVWQLVVLAGSVGVRFCSIEFTCSMGVNGWFQR